eukprot:PhM_4_TR11656/c5_g2_i4/m.16396
MNAYGVYVPSGLFVPSLSLGASFGHLYAQVINHIVGVSDFLSPSHFSLFGGLAMLGGTTRMTISIIVILMEATANTSFFYPFVIITVFAKLADHSADPETLCAVPTHNNTATVASMRRFFDLECAYVWPHSGMKVLAMRRVTQDMECERM